ncbi:kinase-like protein [Cylindrobasidium torrendii FP15055 ss-10]|uniref:Kinase-like protein n=1 Tax=Cylindrobasidium torrendii FP15055 ss-10 TaxID=1314674 RepID=A0A0D7B8J1_9AGAR|nr:kinase-like protein [Cylindrobasidium torrendii FP15055 ss-10]
MDTEAPTSLVTTKSSGRINQYKFIATLHHKNHGDTNVRLCLDEDRDREVVIKGVKRKGKQENIKALRRNHHNDPPSSQQSIDREIAILRACRHPCHVQLLEVIDDPQRDTVYIALEHLSGGPVQWEHNGRPALTLDQSRRVLRDVILGLEYLHTFGIIHRDIKPANIVWSEDRAYAKIIDYGIAHWSESRVPPEAAHCWNLQPLRECRAFRDADLLKVRGTNFFYAPEVIWYQPEAPTPPGSLEDLVKPPITPSVDIWCLGVTAYLFFFGHFPFNPPPESHNNPYALNRQILEANWEVAPEGTMGADAVPVDCRTTEGNVTHLLDQMLQKDPTRRIPLHQLKRHPWILDGISEPEHWLNVTDPLRLYCRSSTSRLRDLVSSLVDTPRALVRMAWASRRVVLPRS